MKIRVVLITVPLVLSAIALAGGFVLVWRLFFLSLLVLLLSYAWTLLGSRGIDSRGTKVPEHSQVGEWFEREISVVNRSRLPKLLIEMRENTDLPGYHNMLAFSLPAQGSRHWRSQVFCRRRGRYSLGSFTTTVTDPLGLFPLHRNFGENKSILVYPATVELPFFSPLSYYDSGHSPTRWLGTEISSSAARIREYAPGDSFNRIHWRSTARTGELMVKVFDPERSPNIAKTIWIIPDMHLAAHLGNDDQSTEEYCVTIAASLIKKYVESGTQVGLITAGDRPYLFPPETGDEHLWHLLEVLAIIRATSRVPLEQLISGEIKRFAASSVVVAITPSPSLQMVASFRHAVSRGIMAVAILLDPASFGGTASAAHTARRLIASGTQVYVVKRGDDLATALDSRVAAMNLKYVADRA